MLAEGRWEWACVGWRRMLEFKVVVLLRLAGFLAQ